MPDLTAYNWHELSPATSPPARYGHVMVWDGARIILHGGRDAATGAALTDTWEFDGITWANLSPATTPPQRFYPAMIWDGTRALLFGGQFAGVYLDELWEFTGGDWNQLSPADSPPGRYFHDMVWDGSRVLLYAGYDSAGMLKDTWEYVGGNWNELVTAAYPGDLRHRTPPPAGYDGRRGHRMTWDGARVVLFSGVTDDSAQGQFPSNPYYESGGGTWVFAAGNWTQPGPVTSPPARHEQGQAITDDDQKTLMYGGNINYTGHVGLFFDDHTWQFDGTDWTDLLKFGPGARGTARMVWDDVNNRFLLFGGRNEVGFDPSTVYADTWEFAPDVPPPVEFVTLSHTFGLGR